MVPGPVVSTQWLADRLGARGLLVVDASVQRFERHDGGTGYLTGHESYVLHGHIPGAVFADLIDDFSEPDAPHPFTRPSDARSAAAAGALGVADGVTVVVYDRDAGQWAARLWWLLRSAGHDDIAVLDGGLSRWQAEGRPLDLGHVEPSPAVFVPHPRPGSWAERDEVEGRSAGEGGLVCALPTREFAAGHIPGSTGIPVSRLLDRQTNTLLPETELRALFAEQLALPRVVTYCRGGIAATADALALTMLGHPDVAVYDGSLNEWTARSDAPLATS